MKKSTKIIISVLSIVVLAFLIQVGIDSISLIEVTPSGAIDENGNAIIVDEVPYYGYIEKRYWNEDINAIREYNENAYHSKEYNGDYLISDYEDGVCIDRYFGEEEEVLVIPETIDGKKVVKLGRWCVLDENGEELFDAHAYGMDNETMPPKVKEIIIPSGVKDIVAYSFSGFDTYHLKKITVSKDNPYYYSFAGMLFSKETNKLLFAPILWYRADNVGAPYFDLAV